MPATAKAGEAPIEALPLEERIRRRAYELYVERGNQSGSELDDWLQAEEEVLQAQG
jgi:outer membrane protein TolC